MPYINKKTAEIVRKKNPTNIKPALTRSWILDGNLAVTTKEVVEIKDKRASALDEANKRINVIKDLVQKPDIISTTRKESVLRERSRGRESIRNTKERVKSNVSSLERVGVRRRTMP